NRRRRSPACGRFPRSAGGFVGEPVDLGELLGSAQTQLTSDNAADVLDQPSLPGGPDVETLRVEVEAAQVSGQSSARSKLRLHLGARFRVHPVPRRIRV